MYLFFPTISDDWRFSASFFVVKKDKTASRVFAFADFEHCQR